ncbi:hypothetical protein CONPUDRAFT_168006 [Coniophora puteana RWD-64-598 SS2]|uniref:F-box domain-containing protein n=1 Tax=Coniophora puteana (strain RWD-64-598) TaxID=741705 RepID=A0A5M3MH06_CONPW|nr:uncharacterized protein CONPUDRAFT_168006 [Coniophora puteana RWD-64-598 SS2]EIW78054.1 hypothetical protein CONPUDRAFT_168006 [Coniophora puteana RWD-64-598 SS2]
MHSALSLPEIVRMICAKLHPFSSVHRLRQSSDKKQNKRALGALARTCRAFRAPALDILWMDVEMVHHLMVTLSDESRVKLFGENEKWYITEFLSAPSPSDIDRLCEYTDRIRKLTVGSGYDYSGYLAGSLLREPVSLSPGRVFPKLQHLVVEYETHGRARPPPMAYSFHRPLLLPYITTLELHLMWDYEDVDMLLGPLPEACPGLQHLIIRCLMPDVEMPSILRAVSQSVIRIPNIISLCCPDLEDDAFAHVSSFSNLRELTLTSMNTDSAERKSGKAQGTGILYAFPALDTLTLGLRQLSDAVTLLCKYAAVPLSVELKLLKEPLLEEINRLFDALRSHPGGAQIQQVKLVHPNFILQPHDAFHNPPDLQLSTFRPLFHFRTLRSINVDFFPFPRVALTKDELLGMARTWPLLEDLSFPHLKEDPKLSFDDVLEISAAFPRLEDLALPFDWDLLEEFEDPGREIPERSQTIRALRNMDYIKYEKLAPVSTVLARSFPNLGLVDTRHGPYEDVGDVLVVAIRKLRMDGLCGQVDRWTVDDLAMRVVLIFDEWKASWRRL